MTDSSSTLPLPATPSGARKWLWVLCAVAAVRIGLFSAVFPFGHNVDEAQHFDLVLRYSQGDIPRQAVPLSDKAARYLSVYASPEYLSRPERVRDGKLPPPPSHQPPEQALGRLQRSLEIWTHVPNQEAFSPPLYYLTAGAWFKLGSGLGLEGAALLYWLRCLNVLIGAGLVWLTFAAARLVFPHRPFVQFGAPLLAAFFPQDIFYSVQSDVLSSLCGAVAFICLVRWLSAASPGLRLSAVTGLALAAMGLVKTANMPMLAVASLAVVFRVGREVRNGRGRSSWPALGALVLGLLLPLGGWWLWCQVVRAGVSDAALKMAVLGWTRKPLSQWSAHPLFTWSGQFAFWPALLASFWRGEGVWLLQPLASAPMDVFYAASSVACCGVALFKSLGPGEAGKPELNWALWLGGATLVGGGLFLAGLSLTFDFGSCYYPSRAHPYFTSGRLLSGALVPFFLLYVRGLEWALGGRWGKKAPWVALGSIVLLVSLSQLLLTQPVFSSEYNFFNL